MCHARRRAFTLIELLVVICIIALLASILFPIFAKAQAKAWQTTCTNNQRQIIASIQIYAQDNDEIMPQASAVWQNLGIPRAVLLCPAETTGKLSNTYGYASTLGGVTLGNLNKPDTTFVTSDWNIASTGTANVITTAADLSARHQNNFISSYLDGHVAAGQTLNFTYLPTGYTLHLDASVTSSVLNTSGQPAGNGDVVNNWNGSDVGTNNMAVPTSGSGSWWDKGPTLQTNVINGLSALKFVSASPNRTALALPGDAVMKTLLIVLKVTGGSAVFDDSTTNSLIYYNGTASGLYRYRFAQGGSATSYFYFGKTATTPVYRVFALGADQLPPTPTQGYILINGETPILAGYGLTVRINTIGTAVTYAQEMDGYIAEIIGYSNAPLSLNDATAAVNYLTAKYGL